MTILRPLGSRLPLRSLVLMLPESRLWLLGMRGHVRECRGENLLSYLLSARGAELRELVLDTAGIVMTKSEIFAISTHCTKHASLAILGMVIEGR